MIKKNVNIIELIIAILIIISCKLIKSIKILFGYYGLKYSLKTIIKAINQVIFENTIIGHTIYIVHEIYSKHFDQIQLIVDNITTIFTFILFNSVIKYFPPFVLTFFAILKNLKICKIIFCIITSIDRFITDLIRIYCY